ncbi:MAG TPA: type II secretion system protein GspK [Rhizomicrobium sp.]
MSRQRGLALVSVLWGVAILSLIAAAMLSASVTSAHLDRNGWNAARAGSVADEAVNHAILSLLDARASRQPRVDAAPVTLAIGGVPVRLWIQDESGKINLNFAPKELLQSLFASAGLESSVAGALADRIVARRPATDGTGPRLAFRSVDELLTVPGVSGALYARIAPALTVYGKDSAINEQVAPREALRALPQMDDQAIDRLFKERDERHSAASGDQNSATSVPLGIADAVFLVTAEARVDGAHVVRVAAVQFTGDAAKPYLVLAWR